MELFFHSCQLIDGTWIGLNAPVAILLSVCLFLQAFFLVYSLGCLSVYLQQVIVCLTFLVVKNRLQFSNHKGCNLVEKKYQICLHYCCNLIQDLVEFC